MHKICDDKKQVSGYYAILALVVVAAFFVKFFLCGQ